MKPMLALILTVCLFVGYLFVVFMLIDYASVRQSELTVEEAPAETKSVTQAETEPETIAETAEQTEEVITESVVYEETVIPRYELSQEEFHTVCRMVEGEASDQDYIGKALVAQCILLACERDGIEPSEVRIAYKYAGWKEDVTEDTKEAVYDVFFFGKLQTDKLILYFYDPRYCVGEWHETQNFAFEYGCHRFFEEAS